MSILENSHVKNVIELLLNMQQTEMLIARRDNCGILFINEAAEKRIPPGDINGSCIELCRNHFPCLCELCQKSAELGGELAEREFEDKTGSILSVGARQLDWIDGAPAIVFSMTDITWERKTRQKLYSLAYLDNLTGIPNRQKLKEDFALISDEIYKENLHGIMVILDLDNFKGINDTYGHNTGDVMLRRLTEHLRSDPVFAGHIYRLGGDEFVLLFSHEKGRFSSFDESMDYYDKLLDGALVEYTMPGIDLSCTLSMGVAFFPRHGLNISELLRKADIALYKAKAAGRDQKCFFEDTYDVAKKFNDMYINIQPLLYESGLTFGYSLLESGSSGTKNAEKDVSLSGFNRALDILGLNDIESPTKYFIAFSSQLLNEAVKKNLPKDKFIIVISAPDVCPPEIITNIRQLKSYGYFIAVDSLKHSNSIHELMQAGDYFRFARSETDSVFKKRLIEENKDKIFVAENIDTRQQLDEAKHLGFRLFQGTFFRHQPIVKKAKEIDVLKGNYYRLLKLTGAGDRMDFKEVISIISSDVALTYKLLKLINSADLELKNISSISMAVTHLGEETLKKWISLLALRGAAQDKPLELIRTSLIRARFGEQLSAHFQIKTDPKQVFLVGLLSLMHIALDITREELLEEIPVSDDIRQSLLTNTGIYSELLSFFSNYEYSNWDEVARFAEENCIDNQVISECYILAVKWCNELEENG